MFRTLGHSARHPSIHNYINTANRNNKTQNANATVSQDFLEDLIRQMTDSLQTEYQDWMQQDAAAAAGGAPSKTSYDARAFLHFADARLKQVFAMSNYYMLSFAPASASSTVSSSSLALSLSSSTPTATTTTTKAEKSRQVRILPKLVETHLLTPHFTTQYILHPTSLYPILEDFDDSHGRKDVKLLYQ
jgi:hypothetical protein